MRMNAYHGKLFVELHTEDQVGDVVELVGLDVFPHVREPPELLPENAGPPLTRRTKKI
jgi:hypothetical protein